MIQYITLGLSAVIAFATGINVWLNVRYKEFAATRKADLAVFKVELIKELNGTYARSKEVEMHVEQADSIHEQLAKGITEIRACLELECQRCAKLHEEFVACRTFHEATRRKP